MINRRVLRAACVSFNDRLKAVVKSKDGYIKYIYIWFESFFLDVGHHEEQENFNNHLAIEPNGCCLNWRAERQTHISAINFYGTYKTSYKTLIFSPPINEHCKPLIFSPSINEHCTHEQYATPIDINF